MSLLDVLCIFDWITPAVSLLDQGSITIGFHADQAGAVCDALKKAGIKHGRPGGWGDKMMLDISKNKEDKARRVLRRFGIE